MNTTPDGRPQFEISRVFEAPPEVVWAAWTEATRLAAWWGSAGCELEICGFDFRPGGFFHYAMRFAGAPAMWGRFNYREIDPLERIVWLNSFANAQGGMARAPFSEACPLEVQNAVSFTEQAGSTRVVLQATPFGAPPDECVYFAELCSSGSLDQGYGGSFDRLANHLAQRPRV